MDALVVYCSQTGSAQTYATWLAEDLACPAEPLDRLEELGPGRDLVVLCSWFHAASIKGSKHFRAYMAAHPEQRFAVVGVGATPMPDDTWPADEIEQAFRRSFPADAYPDLVWCYCRGNYHYERLNPADKVMMRIYLRMCEREARRGSRRDAIMVEGMRAGFDGCDRSYLEPLKRALGITGS